MATDESFPSLPDEEMDRLRSLVADVSVPERVEAGDVSRMSMQTFIAQATRAPIRSARSSGALRFSGPGVQHNRAELDDIGRLSSAWQRAISATGAALTGARGSKGRLPRDVLLRTQLLLTASPAAGSIVFHLEPKQSPLDEVQPTKGQEALTEDLTARPLADRAAEALVNLLATGEESPEGAETMSEILRELGPRVGSAVTYLAHAIDAANVTVDAAWQEPDHGTRRAKVTPSVAKYIAQVIEGRGLDAEPVRLVGRLRTISDSQRWVLDLGEETVRLDASELPESELRKWNLHDEVAVEASHSVQERPDGRTVNRYVIRSVHQASGQAPTLYADLAEDEEPYGRPDS